MCAGQIGIRCRDALCVAVAVPPLTRSRRQSRSGAGIDARRQAVATGGSRCRPLCNAAPAAWLLWRCRWCCRWTNGSATLGLLLRRLKLEVWLGTLGCCSGGLIARAAPGRGRHWLLLIWSLQRQMFGIAAESGVGGLTSRAHVISCNKLMSSANVSIKASVRLWWWPRECAPPAGCMLLLLHLPALLRLAPSPMPQGQ